MYIIKLSLHAAAKMEVFFYIGDVKKKEVSETERRRNRGQTASSA